MAYKQKHKYGYRDSLEKGDPEKVIYGQQFDDEFEAIEEAIADIDPNADGGVDIGEIDGLQDLLDDKADKDHTHDEYLTDAPNDGKQYVRESEAWAEIVIPDDAGIEEPSPDGTPYARQVEGGQTAGAWVEAATPEDIEYLDGRIDAIEGNISGGGGFVEAPNDGSDYARNGLAPAWVKTYNADYIDDIETAYKNADAVLEGQINALEPYDDTQIKADLAAEEQARIDGDAALQGQIDGLPDQDFSWDSITGKPTDYPPSSHSHTTDQITGLDAELDGIKGDVVDLEGAVGSLTGQLAMGGSYSASTGLVVTANLSDFTAGQPLPDPATVLNTFVIVSESGSDPENLSEGDWLVAGSAGWVAIKYGSAGTVDWGNIENVPSEFPPSAHNHDGVYQPVGDYLEDADGSASNDGHEYARKNGDWVKLEDHLYNGHDAVKITGDQSAAGKKTWADDATFGGVVNFRDRIHGDTTANFTTSVSSAAFIKTGGTSDQFLMADGSTSEGGSSVQIGAAFDGTPQEGDQWMEVPADGDATMWIYDGAKWLQHPGGKDGADGQDGADGGIPDAPSDTKQYARQDGGWSEVSSGLWTDNGDTSISYTAGNVSIDNELHIGDRVSEEPLTLAGEGTPQDWGDGVTRYRMARFENSNSLAASGIRSGLSFWHDNNRNAVIQSAQNGGSLGLGVRESSTNQIAMNIDSDGRVDIMGSLYVNGTPKIGYQELIKTLSTLRNATKDETTLEGLRDSIGNAIGGLIEEFENQIAEMSAEDVDDE